MLYLAWLLAVFVFAAGAHAVNYGVCYPLPGCSATSRAHLPHGIAFSGQAKTPFGGECASFRRQGAPKTVVMGICQDSGCSARCLNINEGDCFDAQPGQQWRCFEKYAGAEEAATAALSSEEVTEA